jgi:hypothetical protein
MKATTWIIVAILAILAVLFGIMWMGSAGKISAAEKKAQEEAKKYEEAKSTLEEVTSSLESLDKDLLGTIEGSSEIPGSTPEERRTRLITNISNMRTQIETDKKKIADLESQLARSNGKVSGLDKMINNLKASLAKKEKMEADYVKQLAELEGQRDSDRKASQEEIALRESQIKDKQTIIENMNQDNNVVYYAVGTRKELIAKGIVDRKGGILGIGRVTTVSKELYTDKFQMMNLLDATTLTFGNGTQKFAVLSNHVASSYKVENISGKYQLTVTDPELFRKQKFLVIELR